MDAIVDWVDLDEVPEPAGAESLYYQTLRPSYQAANTSLQTLLELRLIKGITPEIIEKRSTLVTVYPQGGESKVNLNTADPRTSGSRSWYYAKHGCGIVQARPFKTIQELDRVSSFEDIGKKLR